MWVHTCYVPSWAIPKRRWRTDGARVNRACSVDWVPSIVKYLLLSFLEDGPTYGLDLKQRHDGLVGVVAGPVNVGQIYTTLGRLEKNGLVTHTAQPSEVGPDRKIYELTEDGSKELRVWLETPPAAPELKSDALIKIVAAIQLRHPDVPALIRDHRQQCLEALKALDLAAGEAQQVEHDDKRIARDALVQAAALHLQADLRWLDHIETTVPDTSRRGATQ